VSQLNNKTNWWQAVKQNKKIGNGILCHNRLVGVRDIIRELWGCRLVRHNKSGVPEWDIINFGGATVVAVG
jgi:hypothetical protein